MSNEGSAPVLVLERVERVPGEPHRLAGAVSFGGHRLRVVIEADPRFMGLIKTVEAPQLLMLYGNSQGAVARAMGGILAGDDVALPIDLTENIHDFDPPPPHESTDPGHPFTPVDPVEEARLDAAADAVDVRLDRVEWPAPGVDPPLVVADVVVDGVPMTVKAWVYVAPGAQTKLFWVGSHRPESREQMRAVSRVLLARWPNAGPEQGR